jgi:hypothetical protein
MKTAFSNTRGLVTGLALLLAGSLSAGVQAADNKSSGFLSPSIEAKLQKGKLANGNAVMRWVSSELNSRDYQAIMVDRIIFYPTPNPGPQISSSTLDAIAQHLTYTLRQKIGAKIPVVDKAGPGVLRMQAAITAVTAKKEGLSAKDILPVHLLFSAATSASGKMNEDVVARVEARVTDSVSGQMRAAAIVTLEGKQLQGKKDQLQLQDLQQALDTAASDSAATLHNAMAN